MKRKQCGRMESDCIFSCAETCDGLTNKRTGIGLNVYEDRTAVVTYMS